MSASPSPPPRIGYDEAMRFNTFGFLGLPGLFSREEALALREEFDQIVAADHPDWDPSKGSIAADRPLERGVAMRSLLDDDRLYQIPELLLGHDFLFEGANAHMHVGDTPWHGGSGVLTLSVPHIKVSLYLDDVDETSGCLRVLPGAHRNFLRFLDRRWEATPDYYFPVRNRNVDDDFRPWGVRAEEVPHIALPSRLGDVLVFPEELPHASFGNAGVRRQLAISFLAKPTSAEQVAFYKSRRSIGAGSGVSRFLLDHPSDRVRRMAEPLVELGDRVDDALPVVARATAGSAGSVRPAG